MPPSDASAAEKVRAALTPDSRQRAPFPVWGACARPGEGLGRPTGVGGHAQETRGARPRPSWTGR